jgi:hypothetical protein
MMWKSVLFIPNAAALGLLYFSTLMYSCAKRFVPLIRPIHQFPLGDFLPWVYEPQKIKLPNGRMGSEWILGRLAGGCRGDQFAQDRGQGWALVNTVMNLQVLAPQSYFLVNTLFTADTAHI